MISCSLAAQDPAQNSTPEKGAAHTSPSPEPSGTPTFLLDLEATAAGAPVVLSRPEDGLISLNIICGGTAPAKVELRTTAFTSDTGSVAVDILADCGNPASRQPEPVTVPVQSNAIVPLCLFIHPLPRAATYTGRLIISAPGAAPILKALAVAQPSIRQGTLVLDHSAISQTVSGADPVVGSVVLSEKTGAIALHGISVRLEQVSNSPEGGFDLEKNITFLLNGKTADDLDRFSPAIADLGSRTIPVGGQSVVNMRLHDLGPGDYAAILRFSANNSEVTDAQKLQINVHVRRPLWSAVACLIVALIVSLVATKVLTSQRRRASLLQQIHALQPLWLSSLPPNPPVVWVKAVLHQAQRLSRRFWLTSPDLIEANVNNVKSVIGVLDAARQLREQLEVALDSLVFKRVVLALDRVVARLGTVPLTDSALQGINADLAAFKDWLSDDKFVPTFWKEIHSDLQSLLIDMEGANLTDLAGARQLADTLKKDLTDALATPPTTRHDIEVVYSKYCRLKILWDYRDDWTAQDQPAQKKLVDLLALADKRLWERIKGAALTIGMPDTGDPDGLEAYDILQFSVVTTDSIIEHSYLFRHKVEYHWNFLLEPTTRSGKPANLPPLQPRSLGPSVVQYFYRPGKTTVSVKLVYDNDAKDVPAARGPTIKASSDFQPYKILEWTEIASWVIAALLAIVTGLTMFYFKGTYWGTIQDYLTLFLWGIGVDQGKNFLQALQIYSPQPVSPPAAAHA